MVEPLFDGWLTRFGAGLLTAAVLVLFAAPFADALGVNVPVVSSWIDEQQADEHQEVLNAR